jgi:hypothetical protein
MTTRIISARVEVCDYEDVRYHMQNYVARALRLAAHVESPNETWVSQAHMPCVWIPSCLQRGDRCHVECFEGVSQLV